MKNKILTYLCVLIVSTVVFLSVYGFTNLHAETASHYYRFYFDWERSIPLIPAFIVFYISLNLLFVTPLVWASAEEIITLGKRSVLAVLVAGLFFYFFPAPTAYIRPTSVPNWDREFGALFTIDRAFNTFPSLHITFSFMILFTVWQNLKLVEKGFMSIWVLLISLSVLFTHQHQVLDIVSGIALAWGTTFVFKTETLKLV